MLHGDSSGARIARLPGWFGTRLATAVRRAATLRWVVWSRARVARIDRLLGSRWRNVLGWVAVFAVIAWFQGGAVLRAIEVQLGSSRVSGDALQQIFPFFVYLEPEAFEGDYVTEYYLACYPLGYWGLYASLASVGVDPLLVSRVLPCVLWLLAVAGVGAAAHRLGGKLAALAAMALVLGSNVYLARIAGGLPRGFGFPILALTLYALAHGRVFWCAASVLLGALFYPVAAVISGFSLAVLLLAPGPTGLSTTVWTWPRRLRVLAGTAALAVLVLLPSAVAASRYGEPVRPAEVAEFPEIGRGGRYDPASRPPFAGFFATVPEALDGVFRVRGAARDWLQGSGGPGGFDGSNALTDVLFVSVLLGWTSFAARSTAARRVLAFGVAAVAGYTLSRFVVPYAYLPERYVAYSVPLAAILLVSTAVAGLFPESVDEGRPRVARTLSLGAYALLLVWLLAGRVVPDAGLGVDLRRHQRLFAAIAELAPDAMVAGWPKGPINRVPLAARRRVLLTHEVHQAFHKGYIHEMRRRTGALVAAYFATSLDPIVRLRDEFGVTHLLVDRGHFSARPDYFRPFNATIAKRWQAARGDFELPRQFEKASVFSRGGLVLLDLSKLSSASGGARERSDGRVRRRPAPK